MSSTHYPLAPAKILAGLLLVISFALTACSSALTPARVTPSSTNLSNGLATREVTTVTATTAPTLELENMNVQSDSTPDFTATHPSVSENTPLATITRSVPTATVPPDTATPELPAITAMTGTPA